MKIKNGLQRRLGLTSITTNPLGEGYTFLASLLHTRDTWKPPCCWCGKLDSRRVCDIFSGKWSCVFLQIKKDEFPSGWGWG